MLQCTDNFTIFDKSTDRAAHVNVSCNAIFSSRSTSRSEKKNPLFEVEIVVKKQIERDFTLFPNIFSNCFCMLSEQKYLKGKSDAYK